MSRMQAFRLRLLFVAGILVPGAMLVLGLALSYLATGAIPPGLGRVPPWRSVLLGLATGGLSMGVVALLGKLSPRLEEALQRTGTRVAEEALELAGYPVMLLVVTMAALGEESLFRGGLQPLVGLVPASLLFGFSHGGWRRENWAYAVAASLSGLLYGAVFLLTGDLWVTVIAHALHNVASTLLVKRRVVWERRGFLPVPRLVEDERRRPWEVEPGFGPEDGGESGSLAEARDGLPTGPEAEPRAEPGLEPGAAAEIKEETKEKTEEKSHEETETKTEVEAEPAPEPDTAAEPEPVTKLETAARGETVPEPDPGGETEAAQAEADGGPGAESPEGPSPGSAGRRKES